MWNPEHVGAARQGADAVRRLRETDPGAVLELSGADLRGVQLSSVDLRGSQLGGCFLSGSNLAGANLEGVDLSGAHLWGVELTGANCAGANFTQADLNGARLAKITLTGAVLANTNLIGANLAEADLKGLDLAGANLLGAKLRSAHVDEADLSTSNLRNSCLAGACLAGANLEGANLAGADCTDANLHDTNLREASLERARLAGAGLGDADLEGADLSHADLARANLIDARLRGADLSHARLCDARLKGTDLVGARCLRTSFDGCDLTGVVGLGTIDHAGPSQLDRGVVRQLVARDGDPEVDAFLRGCGLAPWELAAARLHAPGIGVERIRELAGDVAAQRAASQFPCGLLISHHASDADYARFLQLRLQDRGAAVWLATHDDSARESRANLDRCLPFGDALILVVSRTNLRSRLLRNLLRYARRMQELAGRAAVCTVLGPDGRDTFEASLDRVQQRLKRIGILQEPR
ncbi:MAG: pentapeptide repeat-containing protein [Planctomycetota bacterium]